MVLDHLDDKRIALTRAVENSRIPIAKKILVGIYDIEHALRVRIGRLDESDWGRRLDELMTAIDDDFAAGGPDGLVNTRKTSEWPQVFSSRHHTDL